MSKSVFIRVNYKQFRRFISGVATKKVKGKGFETAIYDHSGNIQAIIHAASIDQHGQCYPAQYHIRNHTSQATSRLAA